MLKLTKTVASEVMICIGEEVVEIIPYEDIFSVVVAGGVPPEEEMVMTVGRVVGSDESDIFFKQRFKACCVCRLCDT